MKTVKTRGSELRSDRKNGGHKQLTLAKAADVSSRTVWTAESGGPIRLEFLQRIALVLGHEWIKYVEEPDPSKARSLGLIGEWAGILRQAKGRSGKKNVFPVEFEMSLDHEKVLGTFTMHPRAENGDRKNVKLQISGEHVCAGEFVKLEYWRNNKPGLTQFGAILLRSDPLLRNLHGHLVGYGPYSDDIVHGHIEIKKIREKIQVGPLK